MSLTNPDFLTFFFFPPNRCDSRWAAMNPSYQPFAQLMRARKQSTRIMWGWWFSFERMCKRGIPLFGAKSLLFSVKCFTHKRLKRTAELGLTLIFAEVKVNSTYVDSTAELKFIFLLFPKNFWNHISFYMQKWNFTSLSFTTPSHKSEF